ncbi:hypothetical protein Y032_0194g1442 [Ancylostoma ceylanicum]|uniref:Uncharacterized protein n=1 Tax=Ancylostoma ceylanicum TaxID=53326 RepID=A0A016SPZ7_9BILA|nr:hypothetical protein Y032_0194g1442 [Ancylostoma ceylanicum]
MCLRPWFKSRFRQLDARLYLHQSTAKCSTLKGTKHRHVEGVYHHKGKRGGVFPPFTIVKLRRALVLPETRGEYNSVILYIYYLHNITLQEGEKGEGTAGAGDLPGGWWTTTAGDCDCNCLDSWHRALIYGARTAVVTLLGIASTSTYK